MNVSLVDGMGLLLAVAAFGVVLVLPGAALAALSGSLGFRDADGETKPLVAIVAGLALLPALDSLTTRFAGLNVALGLNLALVVLAVVLAVRQRWNLSVTRVSLALLAVWLAVLTAEWIDYDIGGGLYQPFIAVDMVKHAATTQAIYDTGAPPQDPFFFRPERVSYYYFFYTLAALAQRLCGGLIDARAAVGGLVFWTAIGLYGVARLVMAQAGLVSPGSQRRLRVVLLGLLAASGIEIVFVLRLGPGATRLASRSPHVERFRRRMDGSADLGAPSRDRADRQPRRLRGARGRHGRDAGNGGHAQSPRRPCVSPPRSGYRYG